MNHTAMNLESLRCGMAYWDANNSLQCVLEPVSLTLKYSNSRQNEMLFIWIGRSPGIVQIQQVHHPNPIKDKRKGGRVRTTSQRAA